MSWEWDERYANWLPAPLTEQIKGHESERFRRLVQAIQGVADSIPDSEHIRNDPAAFLRLGPWLDHVNRCDGSTSPCVDRPGSGAPRAAQHCITY